MSEPAEHELPGTGLLVGYGSIGRRHLTNLHGLGVRDWAVVHTGSGTVPFEPPAPVRAYPTLSDALASERPGFAVVANPTALHVDTALACVEHGCDLLLEKPVSHTTDRLDLLVRAVDEHDARVLVGFQFRFDPGLARVAAILRDGEIGAPVHVRCVWGEHLPDWHPWEDWRRGYAARAELGGGVHHTICHPLDYLQMLFGDPVDVRAALSDAHPLGLDVAEAADVSLRFAGAVDAELHLDYWARPPTHRLEIVGTEGSATWDHRAGELRVWRAGPGEWSVEAVPGLAMRDELFVRQSRHFLDVLAGRAEPACSLRDGVAAVELAAAIEASAADDGRRVTLAGTGRR
jgi:predicted dehydrogenase